MEISKDEITRIANLASLNIKEEELDKYALNLQDILNFADIVSSAPVEELSETIGILDEKNVFRKDEIIEFEDKQSLLQNAQDIEYNMFRIPKVLN